MPTPTEPQTGADVMAQFIPSSPFVAKLGIVADLLDADEVRLRLPWDPTNVTIGDMVHGGAIDGRRNAPSDEGRDGLVPDQIEVAPFRREERDERNAHPEHRRGEGDGCADDGEEHAHRADRGGQKNLPGTLPAKAPPGVPPPIVAASHIHARR